MFRDRLFSVKPVRKAHEVVHNEDLRRELDFRHDADGAGLDVAKEKLEHFERSHSVSSYHSTSKV